MNKDYSLQILGELNKTIANRDKSDCEKSYTKSLLKEGVKRISQKVGEEGVEVALAGLYGDKLEIANESADLVYHLLVLLYATKVDFNNVTQVLRERMKK
jgi:phosphoribosyl-ATP pyrophosphohydrolase/phosphoribosyl-AMP cyclohydrolase